MGYDAGRAGQELGVGLIDAATGAAFSGSVTAYRSVNGGPQTAVDGTVSDQGNGQFVLTMSSTDLPGPETSFWFTATGAVPVELTVLTGRGAFSRQPGQHFGFGLIATSTGAGLPGATVSVYRSVDGAAQAAATGTVTDLGGGQYDYSPSVADLAGEEVTLTFAASGAVPVTKTLTTLDDDTATEEPAGPSADIQQALVSYLGTRGEITALIGVPPALRMYPEQAPDITDKPYLIYTLQDDQRPTTVSGGGGWGEARFLLQCWGDSTRQSHMQVNALYLALLGVFKTPYRGLMGGLSVQFAAVSDGAKATPPPVEGKIKGDACATLTLSVFFDDL